MQSWYRVKALERSVENLPGLVLGRREKGPELTSPDAVTFLVTEDALI